MSVKEAAREHTRIWLVAVNWHDETVLPTSGSCIRMWRWLRWGPYGKTFNNSFPALNLIANIVSSLPLNLMWPVRLLSRFPGSGLVSWQSTVATQNPKITAIPSKWWLTALSWNVWTHSVEISSTSKSLGRRHRPHEELSNACTICLMAFFRPLTSQWEST
jgi:hypothetical protein